MIGQSSILVVFCVIVGSLAKPPPTFLEYKDSLGQYSFGYSAPGSARSEVRSIDGSTRGSYSYVDVFGNIQTAQYTADGENGFQITATNLPRAPRPVEDTPEVAAARLDHFKALEAASKLADENSQQNELKSTADVARSSHSNDIDKAGDNEKKPIIRAPANGAMSPEASKRSGSDEGSIKISLAANQNQAEAAKGLEQPNLEGPNPKDQLEEKSAMISGRSEIPVVTTSFVVPGSLNLHTRIQLDQSSGAAGRIGPQSSSFNGLEASISQDANSGPSGSTPAGTRMMALSSNSPSEISGGLSPANSASTKSIENMNQSEEPSQAFAPGALPAPNAFVYGIGFNPIYRQYTPYHYIPYAIL
ncbi:uncharacterized protein [Venturia canescens]|uniref:uncharacterized protein n=1 Tax=Venturia canescens TaxID=32260 RepID=UPI001C9C66BB|nr:uncharacterized protein LOC122418996 [Venturia canescens]